MTDIKCIKLTEPPVDHNRFARVDCEIDQSWSAKVIDSIRQGAQVMLANCKSNAVESFKDLCAAHNYVVLILPYPNFSDFCRIYLLPDRRGGCRGPA